MDKIEKMEFMLDELLNNPISLVEMSRNDLDNILKACFIVVNSDIDRDILKSKADSILYYCSFRKDLNLSERWELFWAVYRRLFVNSKEKVLDLANRLNKDIRIPIGWLDIPSLTNLYRYIFNDVFSSIDYSGLSYSNIDKRNSELIVVVTNQFLNLGHAPTTRVLDYAYTLQEKIKKKVIIINSSCTHYHKNLVWEDVLNFHYQCEYDDATSITYKDTRFDFVQIPVLMPNVAVLNEMVRLIYSINPMFVFNIGASDLLADLCTPFVTTASLPCSLGYPISCSEYLLVGRKVSIEDAEYNDLLDYQKVLETNYNYIYRECDTVYNLSDFGIPADSFVIVIIGSRIEEEMDSYFVKLIDDILNLSNNVNNSQSTPIYISIVGGFDKRKEFLEKISFCNRDKVIFTGQILDASEYTRLCNLYLNPERNGGGRSAYDCLHFGVPIVSLKNGDVYYTCGNDFCVNNWLEYFEIVKRYYYDKGWYRDQKDKALKRAYELEQLEATLRNLIKDIFV